MYHYFIKKKAEASFQLVNEHRYTELVKGMALNVKHCFSGEHALGGIRNDQAAVKEWLERLGRLMPDLKLKITKINVEGWPNNTLAFVQWTATATLENGEPYENKGIHLITLKWGKAVEINVHEDSQAVANAMEKQYQSGFKEAKAPPIIS